LFGRAHCGRLNLPLANIYNRVEFRLEPPEAE
jgi:hypothetical protein